MDTCGVANKPNLRLKLEHLEQTGTEIGTENRPDGIKNRECSNVPIYLGTLTKPNNFTVV